MSDSTVLPQSIENYLIKQQEISQMRESVRLLTEDLRVLEQRVEEDLRNMPSHQYRLRFDAVQANRFGREGMLKVGQIRRKEYLSLSSLEKLLHEYFQTKFSATQSSQSISLFAQEAASEVWNRRPMVETTVVKRTARRKKKRKARETQHGDLETEDDRHVLQMVDAHL